jgi:hypothetical protein
MEGAMRWHESDVLRVVVIGGATAAVMVALVSGKPFHSTMADSKAPVTADVSQPVADQISFVTSPTIDTNSEFFFGSGDGSSGYYAAEPPEPTLVLVRYERMP